MLRKGWVLLALLILLAGCTDERPAESGIEPTEARDYIEVGDLPALRSRGVLRILVHREASPGLPRDGYPIDLHRDMAQRFAREQDLVPVLVAVDDYGGLLPALREGQGDLIAANMTVTAARREQAAFTMGLDTTREWLVGRAEGPGAESIPDLRGHRVGVMRDTSFWEVAQTQLADDDAIELVSLPGTLASDDVLDGLARGDYDFAIQDGNVLDAVETYREDLVRAFPLGESRPLAWAVRSGSDALLDALNRFILREQLTRLEVPRHRDDLAGIRERGTLRVITRNNAATYYLYRGELVGFEYELARRFADQLGVRLHVVVADDHDAMLPMLQRGDGDLIAAFLTRTDSRAEQVAFSRPYHHATETVVGRADEAPLAGPEALAGRTLHVRRGSSYWQTLTALQEQGVDLQLEAMPADMETEQIMAHVGAGELDLTLADSHILQAQQTWSDAVQGLLALGAPRPHGWAVRQDNPDLLAAVNDFWSREYRGLYYNIFYRRYFQDDSRMRRQRAGRVDIEGGEGLSQWDDLTRRYAEDYGFDWRLILAQMYQESRFDPAAESWVGARGLMQVMPRTGRELGLAPLDDPEVSVRAGVKYMDWLRDRFPERLPADTQLWFSLAAYNAGVGHVRDARRLAAQQGLDPDRWFGNVEQAMLLLADPAYHQNARHGFVRGQEPVNYVRHIRDRYRAYAQLTE